MRGRNGSWVPSGKKKVKAERNVREGSLSTQPPSTKRGRRGDGGFDGREDSVNRSDQN